MSGKVLGYYGHPRVFHCASCGPEGLSEPVTAATVDDGLDYAAEDCAKCGRWIDETGEETDEA